MPTTQNPSLLLSMLRGSRLDELQNREAMGHDPHASRLASILRGDIANDPFTGDAEHDRVAGIENALTGAATYARPEIADQRNDIRGFELTKAGEPNRVAGQYGLQRENIAQQGGLAQQYAANEGLIGAQIARARGNSGPRPLASALMERVAGSAGSLSQLQRLMGMDVTTGPVAGRVQSAMNVIPGLPANKNFATAQAESTGLLNSVIKATTGAQMSEPEAKRIATQVPSLNDKPEVRAAKGAVLEKSLRGLNVRIGLLSRGVPADVLDQIPVEELENNLDAFDQFVR